MTRYVAIMRTYYLGHSTPIPYASMVSMSDLKRLQKFISSLRSGFKKDHVRLLNLRIVRYDGDDLQSFQAFFRKDLDEQSEIVQSILEDAYYTLPCVKNYKCS